MKYFHFFPEKLKKTDATTIVTVAKEAATAAKMSAKQQSQAKIQKRIKKMKIKNVLSVFIFNFDLPFLWQL